MMANAHAPIMHASTQAAITASSTAATATTTLRWRGRPSERCRRTEEGEGGACVLAHWRSASPGPATSTDACPSSLLNGVLLPLYTAIADSVNAGCKRRWWLAKRAPVRCVSEQVVDKRWQQAVVHIVNTTLHESCVACCSSAEEFRSHRRRFPVNKSPLRRPKHEGACGETGPGRVLGGQKRTVAILLCMGRSLSRKVPQEHRKCCARIGMNSNSRETLGSCPPALCHVDRELKAP